MTALSVTVIVISSVAEAPSGSRAVTVSMYSACTAGSRTASVATMIWPVCSSISKASAPAPLSE